MKRIFTLLLTLVILGVTFKAIHEVQTDKNRLRLKEIKIQNIHQELNKLEGDYKQLNKHNKSKEDEIRKLKEREAELEKQLQAKRLLKAQEAKAYAERKELASKAQTPARTPVRVSGDKYTWLKASGIPESEWWAVDSIVSRESSWNPNAVNPSSGACGLGQQLPCGKWDGAWNDPVAALKAQYKYVKDRYGGYAQAVAFWDKNQWY